MLLTALISSLLISQNSLTDSTNNNLSVNLEVRPRMEFKQNYRLSATETFGPTAYVSQRNRLNINNINRRYNLRVSLQEIHLFLQNGVGSKVGSVNFNELYIEPKFGRNLSVIIGRQNFQLDNGRMFSAAPWSQQHRSHEGLRFQYIRVGFRADFATFFTREYGQKFDVAYSPVASHKYRYLLVQHLKGIQKHLTYTLINSAEIFDEQYANAKRYTAGGRLEYNAKRGYATVSGFYQFGQNQQNQQVSAYYVQPEMGVSINKFSARLGAEILSGNPSNIQKGYSNSYEITYGVAWKFMGNMNFYAKFPTDVASKGLLNPYFFMFYKVTPKFQLRLDSHLFYSQYALASQISKYLGFETDLSFNYKFHKNFDLNYGLSFYAPTSSTLLLKKVEDITSTPIWSYLMISFNPTLYQLKN